LNSASSSAKTLPRNSGAAASAPQSGGKLNRRQSFALPRALKIQSTITTGVLGLLRAQALSNTNQSPQQWKLCTWKAFAAQGAVNAYLIPHRLTERRGYVAGRVAGRVSPLYAWIAGCLSLWDWYYFEQDPHFYSLLRRYSNTNHPISAEMMAIKKFVTVKISIRANAKLFPCPLDAVNSPIKRFE
jgi:hypothetical protein